MHYQQRKLMDQENAKSSLNPIILPPYLQSTLLNLILSQNKIFFQMRPFFV